MSIVWLITLLIHGGVSGYAQIPSLFWWLLLTFVLQDAYDRNNK